MGGIAYCLYHLPDAFLGGASWEMIEEMGPISLSVAVFSFSTVIPIFYLYFTFTNYFVSLDPKEKPYYPIIILSIISGAGNSLVVYIINQALNRNMGYVNRSIAVETGLYIYFILGIVLFTISAMIVRKKLITMTNNIVYEKRLEIINKILKAPFYKFEALEEGKTYAALNNDTETISGIANMFVNCLTGIITMIACLIYLATLNFYAMAISVLVIVFAVFLFLNAGRKAEVFFEKNRDIQNTFFNLINDLIDGFKELYINRKKRGEFKDDIEGSCTIYRQTRVAAEFKFVGVQVMGEMLYIAVIGLVVFTFPLFFQNVQGNTLRNFVLVFLYMGGIVNQQVYLYPTLLRVLVSWRRINEFIKEISLLSAAKENAAPLENSSQKELLFQLKGIQYQYKNENSEKFTVGPLDLEFKSGEIVFFCGGNGSGKSTLAKLITGLYQPDEGEIVVNGEKTDLEALGSYFSTVFSDFHLFYKLYGINYQEKLEEIQKHLTVLRIQDKLQIKDGVFSTLKLSTGQRKRLALLISYLEDRPAYLFDEWAADQDPEFRKFFYKILLPELRLRGKIVIAITHDDRYFGEADKVIRMELGKIVEERDQSGLAKAEVASA